MNDYGRKTTRKQSIMGDEDWYFRGECAVVLACCVALVLYVAGVFA